MNTKTIIGIVVAIAVVVGIAYILAQKDKEPGKYDTFAVCLEEKGAKFYGAFWCPHCQNQKKIFGKSAKLLPYVECSTPDGTSQLPVCVEQEIEGYPTWTFADGTRLSGEIELETLAEQTGCMLPEENA